VQYAEAAEAVGLDSMWLPDKSVSRNPTPEITCMFAMTARCAVEAKADTAYIGNSDNDKPLPAFIAFIQHNVLYAV
jgi:hypothetical protein